MKKLRLGYRFIAFLICVFILTIFSVASFVLIRNKQKRKKITSHLIQFLLKLLLFTMGVKVQVEGAHHLQSEDNYLIVSNHVSYTDIALLHSLINNSFFITHHEIKEQSPILSFIITMAGTYTVERRNLNKIRKELRETTQVLKQNQNLIFFPEGTSTDGSHLLPFYPVFFSTAIRAKKQVLPVYIQYTHIEEEPFQIQNRDLICWYDHKISFLSHLTRLLKLKNISVTIHFLSPISSQGKHSRTLAQESQAQILKNFKSFDSIKN